MRKDCMDKNCAHQYKVTDISTGEITCRNCGVVLSEKTIDYGN